jgi:glutathione S-transferase
MLEELGLDYELVPTRMGGVETRMRAFLDLNPNGKIPVLVDGETVVWESLAINHYLARKYDGGLEPRGVEACGRAYRWSFWAMGELEGPIDAVARLGQRFPRAGRRGRSACWTARSPGKIGWSRTASRSPT